MKILELRAENVKKLKAVHVRPNGALVPIAGKNGAGKSTVLDAIWWALGGAKNVAEVPVRTGAERATITLRLGGAANPRIGDLQELVVTRQVKAGGETSLVVSTPEGARYTSPQGVLDALLGALTFDPLAFSSAEEEQQFEMLRRLVSLKVDLDQLKAEDQLDYHRRTEHNRAAAEARTQAKSLILPDTLPEPVDPQALLERLQAANDANARRDVAEGKLSEEKRFPPIWRRAAEEKRKKAELLRVEASELEALADKHLAEAETEEKRLAAVEIPVRLDTVALREAYDRALRDQQTLKRAADRKKWLEEAEAHENTARSLTTRMQVREGHRRAALSEAKFPVTGLGFGDGVVTYNGLPFAQAATAEQLRVSLAIAAAANPKLKVLLVRRGNDLDADNLAYVANWAAEHGYQVWLERVVGAGPGSVEIVDGAYPAEAS